MLLGGVTALVVARPLVFGEDPGLLAAPTDTATLVLTFLWLLAGLSYAGWCAVTGRSFGRLNGAEWGLLAAAVCVLISAESTSTLYKHPARLIAWEWLGFAVCFLLVRRVAATETQRNGLFAALLASAVSLSAYAVYQAAVELPRDQQRYADDPEELKRALAEQDVYLDADDPYLKQFRRRLLDNHVFGTYSHPNSFAGVLALFLPGLAAAALVGSRGAPRWQAGLLWAGAVLGAAALWLTHSRGALLAVALVGLGTALWMSRHVFRQRKLLALALLLMVAGGGWLAMASGLLTRGVGKDESGFRVRLDYWRATTRMIADRPWWGFGPGNFGNAYPRATCSRPPSRRSPIRTTLFWKWP